MPDTQNVGESARVASVVVEYDLLEVAEAMRCLSERMAEGPGQPLDHLVEVAVERVPGAQVGQRERAAGRSVHHGGLDR